MFDDFKEPLHKKKERLRNAMKSLKMMAELCRELELPLNLGFSNHTDIRCGNKGSLSINVQDAVYNSFEENDGGDLFTLVQTTLNIGFIEALEFVEDIVDRKDQIADINFHERPERIRNPKKKKSKAKDNKKYAQKIWKESKPILGTVVEKYLLKRGITKEVLAELDKQNVLRCHTALYHSPTEKCYPALIVGVRVYEGNEIIGVQRTYINPETEYKADIPKNKMLIGPVRKGAGILGNISQSSPIYIMEGTEDASSVYQMTGGSSTWIGLGTTNIQNIILPHPDKINGIVLEPVQSLLANRATKARIAICRLVFSFRSQFFQSRRHFSSHAKDLSTTHL